MSYNGSGTFNINTTGQPVVAGTIISSASFNALTADLATGLTTALTKDGQTTATARIPFAQGISSTLVTDASSTATGSIITAGGVGIAKKLYVGTDANIAGALGVTGVATFSAAPIYSSLTASSAVATDASKALVSVTNTGTGSNVLATAPTIASLNLTTALTLAGAAGTNGQVLTSAGSGLPTWAAPSAGALTLLSTVTASASATVDIETTFSSTYDAYLLYVVNLTPATAGTIIYARLKIGGSYITSASYTYATNRSNDASGYLSDNAAGDSTIRLISNCSLGQMTINIYSPSNTTKSKMINWQGVSLTSTPNIAFANGVAYVTGTTAAMTGIRIFADSGNITSGTFRLYGISNS